MAAHLSNGSAATAATNGRAVGVSLRDLPKSNNFTSNLPADPEFPSPSDSHKSPREKLGPRLVKDALFTYVRPAQVEEPELLGVSSRAMRDLGIQHGDEQSEEFRAVVAGNKILTWDEQTEEGIYPWAQCYGGWQFGSWASQLGDGRAISLFETTNSSTGKRYEIQLKGAGRTPYSRFADGKAVVRSSIREYIVSEALNALDIPTTRALSLTLLPKDKIVRERIEPGAIVARFAESWLRIGTFDLLRSRGYRGLTRQLAEYVATNVFPGWKSLPARIKSDEITKATAEVLSPTRDIDSSILEGPQEIEENRFARLYREIVRRNASTVAKWQAYAFTNGVLNTDNTSIYGLSIDFGPFAFLDNFDPTYTPNHDDHMLRYSYRNQPTIIWWNLVRLGEDLGELIGAGRGVDEADFREKGVRKEQEDEIIKRAEGVIERAGDEYQTVFLAEYKQLMGQRMGLTQLTEDDFKGLLSDWLDVLTTLELDFNQSFRKLSHLSVTEIESEEQRTEIAKQFFHSEGISAPGETLESGTKQIGEILDRLRQRWVADGQSDTDRQAAMKRVNPKFIPKSWILDELIDRVEKKGERDVLGRVMNMALNPFEEQWGGDAKEEERFCGDVPKYNRAMQCSCSS